MATACAGHQQASAKPGACCCWLTEREEAWRQGQGVKLDCAVLTAIRQKKALLTRIGVPPPYVLKPVA